mmetsp:Transcript_36568/g.53685  ORF Transcript_36568/g.53685 Transcript_36568/m.53685 type:complete len:895 (+) Transcript_36568:216-2900(+)
MATTSILPTSTMNPPPLSTASGLLAMLNEPSPPLRNAALTRLLSCVDTLWHEVAESLPDLEALSEDTELDVKTRETAAAVASRVFFHLEEPTQALRLALESGEYFNVIGDKTSPYVEALVSAAMEAYIKLQRKLDNDGDQEEEKEKEEEEETGIDVSKLQTVVQAMLERCYQDGEYAHALGVALEARQVDKFREILDMCRTDGNEGKYVETLSYALDACVSLVSSKKFRVNALVVVAESLGGLSEEIMDWAALCRCHQLLGKAGDVGKTIERLLDGDSEDGVLLGYQLCFDLVDSGDQGFVGRVAEALPKKSEVVKSEATDAETNGVANAEKSDEVWARFAKAEKVLVGGFSSELALSFLHKQSNSDVLIMENLKKALEEKGGRNSVLHNCAVMAHSYLNAGTTNDSFLRDHLDWMRKASNWAKFSATATLGVIHASHTTEAMTLLEPYLPPTPSATTPVTATGGYSEGGSLFALGLIHGSNAGCSNKTRLETSDFLREHLKNSHANEVISHGAALGVGLTSFGSGDATVVNDLKELLYTDSAVSGEAAGLAIGMVLVGTGHGNSTVHNEEMHEAVNELKNYARETAHEKIIRGIAMSLALINYGQEENADTTIEEMRGDRDPVLRYGAQYAIALAYCGTGSNKAIRILLHTAVSDVNDDVRMAAVVSLAFVLYKTPERVPQLVKLLLESFNPHVRYASCMAVGIAMAGTGDGESVALLEPMLEDMTDFVRQGAIIGTSMIYMQQSDSCNNKKIKAFREKLVSITGDKHMSTLTKMGAIVATGIMDAGGRNCSLQLGSQNGFTKMTSAVGMVLWLQHWHWYPMMHMLSLALTPTFTIGLNKDFKYPKTFEIHCASKPSTFSYPKKTRRKKRRKEKTRGNCSSFHHRQKQGPTSP